MEVKEFEINTTEFGDLKRVKAFRETFNKDLLQDEEAKELEKK